MYDVVVVGAGPSGSAAARECARAGLSTLCIEEHGAVGTPVQCAGLLSVSAFEECRVSPRAIRNRVRGARVVSSLGGVCAFDAGETKAVVVNRAILDREIAERAAEAGAEFRLKTRVCGLSGTGVRTRGVGGAGEIACRMVIAADGVQSGIARMQGLARSPVILSGMQAEMPLEQDPHLVEIHPDASPEFFGWKIPLGSDRVRVGLLGRQDIRSRFARVAPGATGSMVDLVIGAVPLGVMPRTYGRRTLFVGDAAGFPKPTSGGGVYTGVRSARHAAAVAVDCCEEDDFGGLADYERRWRDDFGRELEIGMRLFSLRQHLGPEQIDRILRALDDPAVIRTIIERGDMDRPAALVTALAAHPPLLRAAGTIFLAAVKNVFY
ncbi:MAG: geranylgeranyl reductase family protein [Methanomicrobiales archaeon]